MTENRSTRIGVLGSPTGWYVRDLTRAAAELSSSHDLSLTVETFGFDTLSVRSLESLAVRAMLAGASDRTSHEPESAPVLLNDLHSLLIRTMPLGSLEQVIFRMNALHVAESSGVRVINTPRCLEICIDKWLTLDKARASGLLTPRTIVCQQRDEAIDAWHALGEDCVIKPIFGGEGRGIVRVTDRDMAWRVFSTLQQIQAIIYVQEFLPNAGSDLRLLVIDDELYSVRRDGCGQWRANLSQGGKAEQVAPTFEQADIAYRAAKLVGGWIVGVDLIETLDGRNVLIEVNAVPGWRGTAAACKVDIAKRLLEKLVLESKSIGNPHPPLA
jgi:tetrahydromethanopterin:alpha-L-glutamate ligase